MRIHRRQLFTTKNILLCVMTLFITSGLVTRWTRKTTDYVAEIEPGAFQGNMDHPSRSDKDHLTITEIENLAQGPVPGDDPDLIHRLRKDYLHPPSQKPYNLKENEPRDISYTNYKNLFPSWALIDSLLMDIYSDQPPGFFIEAGALDGEYLSNTLQLEVLHNWTGLLVEADKQSYDILLRKNRKVWSSPACISTESYPMEVVLSSFIRQGKNSVWRDRGASRIEKNPVFEEDGPGYKTFQRVQCFPTLSFLEALNVTKVDFFSLDVEGVEIEILKAFPFERISVDVWAIEHIGRAKNNSLFFQKDFINGQPWEFEDPEIISFMEARGYYLLDMFCNPIPDYIFVSRESDIFKRLKVPPHLWIRRGICFHKPRYDANGFHFKPEIHRDKRHYPNLIYSGDISI